VKRILISLFMALLSLSFVAAEVEAKRLGGGATSGMKRQAPPPAPAQPVPAKPAATPGTAGAAAAPAAVPPKRSWLGPIAGIAAGLGLAALMSHFGMGGEFANILTMLLLAGVAFFAVRWLMRRFSPAAANRSTGMPAPGMQYAAAGYPGPTLVQGSGPSALISTSAAGGRSEPAFASAAPLTTNALPAGFDAPGFERAAKLIFIRMQAANDAGNLDDLRQFATPEMFANFRLELQDRKGAVQQTDVLQLEAQVLEFTQEADLQIVSVRFRGLIREERDAGAATFDEVWHLVRPLDGSREWAIAGIAQSAMH
jgi:predicted lipid-binding transport protein (Tim44 family)